MWKIISFLIVGIVLLFGLVFFFKQPKNQPIVIAYQTGIDPSKLAQANHDYEKNSQKEIIWKKFDTGSDVINALASGDVDIGNIGSSPFAAAASKDLPIDVFLIASQLGASEALVVQKDQHIKTPKDLIGKKIAVPFVSTTHYSLLSALKHWGIHENQVQIINLRPPEIIAAWKRKDIDAAYVWEPALSQTKETGDVLINSQEVGQLGYPTFDLWVVRKDFAHKHPEFMKSFVKTTLDVFNDYQKNPTDFAKNPIYAKKISEITGSKEEDITLFLSSNAYLNQAQQYELFTSKFNRNIIDTAQFLKSQEKLDQIKPDYTDHINASFLKESP